MRRLTPRYLLIDPHPAMDSPKQLQSRPLFLHRFHLLSSNPKHARRYLFIFVASAGVTVAVFLCLAIAIIARGRSSPPSSSQSQSLLRKKEFGIVIDGGSTGTRIHVYECWTEEEGAPLPVVDFGKRDSATMKVNPGLSSFSDAPERAGRSIIELLEFGKRNVPKERWEDTEVRLMATAGLRMLNAEVQERILESCRLVLRTSGFRFQDDWASVISGSDEGVYAWVAANYALGTLGGDPMKTTGIIELGGASAQVTFVSSELLPSEFSRTIKFGEFSYSLYSNSLLHFGQNVAHDSLRALLISGDLKLSEESAQGGTYIDPCTPRGYSPGAKSILSTGVLDVSGEPLPTIHARGNFSECRSAALMLLQKRKDVDGCLYQNCTLGSTFIPKLQGRFLATENFFYTSEFFGLPPRAFLSDLILAGQQFCEEDWFKLKKKYHNRREEDMLEYCFSSAYIVALLHDSLGISLNDERIDVTNHVGDIPLGWALGAFIVQKTAYQTGREHLQSSDDSPALLSLFIVSGVLIFAAWSVAKWRKPHLKTIYDLEKGRYIITHVNR